MRHAHMAYTWHDFFKEDMAAIKLAYMDCVRETHHVLPDVAMLVSLSIFYFEYHIIWYYAGNKGPICDWSI